MRDRYSFTRPMVSAVVPTRNRQVFLHRTIQRWAQQSYRPRELVVVDDSDEFDMDSFRRIVSVVEEPVRLIRLLPKKTIGEKLNVGIAAAVGTYVLKMDDDDLYRYGYIDLMIDRIIHSDKLVCYLDSFLVYTQSSARLVESECNWRAGASLVFSKQAWLSNPFRSTSAGEDQFFLDSLTHQSFAVHAPTTLIVVRHEFGHTWTREGGLSVEDYFAQRSRCLGSPTSLHDGT